LSSAALNAYAGSTGTVGKPWPGLAQVCRIQRVVWRKDRKSGAWRTTEEVAYSVTSLDAKRADAKGLLRRWRVHWQIENRLHWVRDVTFGEDDSQIHKGQAPEVFATLRNAAVALLGWGEYPSIAAGVRELSASPSGVLSFFGRLADRLKLGRARATERAWRAPPITTIQASLPRSAVATPESSRGAA
jgi:predicted transposase YbfD/YdcC